jgi:hypothetical protein
LSGILLLLLFGFVTTTPNDVPTLQQRPITVTIHPELHLYMPEVGEKERIKNWRGTPGVNAEFRPKGSDTVSTSTEFVLHYWTIEYWTSTDGPSGRVAFEANK